MPASRKRNRPLHVYQETLRQKSKLFPCVDCKLLFLPKHYEQHQFSAHRFDPKLNCVWCKKYSWKRGAKEQHSDHLLSCFRNEFTLKRYRPAPPSPKPTPPPEPSPSPEPTPPPEPSDAPSCLPPPPTLRLLDSKHPFAENDPFEIEPDLPPHALDPINPIDFRSTHGTSFHLFRDRNLNLAASCMLLYQQTQKTHDWHHVMVKSVAHSSFREAMETERETCRTLPFSCWCNGGNNEVARCRQHRHLIVFSPKGHFDANVWKKVVATDRPQSNFACKRKKSISNVFHLINTILYVSNRRNRCNFAVNSKVAVKKYNHFYLSTTVPRESRLPLFLLVRGGWERYLYQVHFENASVERVLESPLSFVGGKWRQKLKHFYGFERGLVLPVLPGLAPASTDSGLPAFHLADGRELHFEPRPEYEALDEEAWLAKQAEGGNSFFDALREAWWTPRPKHQRDIGRMKPLLEKNAELEARNAELVTENTELKTENTELKTELKSKLPQEEGARCKRRRRNSVS